MKQSALTIASHGKDAYIRPAIEITQLCEQTTLLTGSVDELNIEEDPWPDEPGTSVPAKPW